MQRAISSVLEQTFNDFEYIVVDDGSDDSTCEIILKFAEKDDRVVPIIMPQNVGRGQARNAGIERANSEFLFFLDADDWLFENTLETLVGEADNAAVDLVFGRIALYEGDVHLRNRRHYFDVINVDGKRGDTIFEFPKMIHDNGIIGRLFRKEMIDENNIRFVENRSGEDILFIFYCMMAAKSVSFVSNYVYRYTVGNWLEAANEHKLLNALKAFSEQVDVVFEQGNDKMRHEVSKKMSFIFGDLRRAAKVYPNVEDLQTYVRKMYPVCQQLTLSDTLLAELSDYQRSFITLLRDNKSSEAVKLWQSSQ